MFAGSLPRGVEPDFYAQLVRELRKLDVMTVVDTDGEALRQAVRAEPDVVSPNVLEAEELVGHEFDDDDERAAGGARDRLARGSRGDHDDARRLLGAGPRRRRAAALYRVTIVPREAGRERSAPATRSSPAIVAARYRGAPAAECLRFGVACGAESTERLGAGLIDVRDGRAPAREVDWSRRCPRALADCPAGARW